MKTVFPMLIAASLILSGCVEHQTVVERGGPPPPYYGPGPGAAPPLVVETYGVAPFPGAVWVRGNWYWANRRWRWHRGHWRH